MPLNVDQLLAVSPHLVLTKIVGEPNLASITLQQSEHNGNLALITPELTVGANGDAVDCYAPWSVTYSHRGGIKVPPAATHSP